MPRPDAEPVAAADALPALRLFGAPLWRRADGQLLALGPERRFQLLALLGYEAQWTARERLATLFWPDRPERAARANLRKVLHELRALHVEGLEEGPAGLRWAPDSDLAQLRSAWAAGDWALVAELGGSPLMQGLDDAQVAADYAAWLHAERGHWQTRWREAALREAGRGDPTRAWSLAQRLLQADGLDEAAMALALRATAALQRPELAQDLWQRHVQRLRDELGVSPAPAMQALAGGQTPQRIAPLAPWVGRETELQEGAALLAGGRLVTVLGTGGVGKSSLTRHLADRVAARFEHGVAFVPLEDARTPDELPSRIAAELGLDLGGSGQPLQVLARRLAPRSLLLVLDGFEAVIDAGPAVLQLLAAAPGLRVLVSSRERLGVDGEWLLPLSGLEVPGVGAPDAELRSGAAVALFLTRARAVNPAFDGQAALASVAAICRRVEGLPLALELAAAWVRLLPAAEIVRELDRGIDFLGRGGGSSLQAVFERSWALLSAAEREALLRLAVFRGGFTRTAAAEVAGVDLGMLAALVDKSMLAARADGRFGMHALLQPQALLKLAERPDAAAIHERHSRWFLALPPRGGPALAGEHDNLLAAWRHAVARGDAPALEAVLFSLPWSAMVRGRLADAEHLFADAAAAFGTDGPTGALLQAHQAWMLLWQQRHARASELARGALHTLRPAGHAAGTVMALRTLGHVARIEGRHAEAAAQLADALDVARAAGLRLLQAVMHDGLAMALNMLGRHEDARAELDAAAALLAELGDPVQQTYNDYNRSQSHSLAQQPALALPWAERALERARAIGHATFLPYAHIEVAQVQLALSRCASARQQMLLARQLALDGDDPAVLAAAHELGARLALAEGHPGPAREYTVAAARLCLHGDSTLVGAAVVLTAARLPGQTQARRWRQALLALPGVPVPVQREARSALQRGSGVAGPESLPASLSELLAEVLSRA